MTRTRLSRAAVLINVDRIAASLCAMALVVLSVSRPGVASGAQNDPEPAKFRIVHLRTTEGAQAAVCLVRPLTREPSPSKPPRRTMCFYQRDDTRFRDDTNETTGHVIRPVKDDADGLERLKEWNGRAKPAFDEAALGKVDELIRGMKAAPLLCPAFKSVVPDVQCDDVQFDPTTFVQGEKPFVAVVSKHVTALTSVAIGSPDSDPVPPFAAISGTAESREKDRHAELESALAQTIHEVREAQARFDDDFRIVRLASAGVLGWLVVWGIASTAKRRWIGGLWRKMTLWRSNADATITLKPEEALRAIRGIVAKHDGLEPEHPSPLDERIKRLIAQRQEFDEQQVASLTARLKESFTASPSDGTPERLRIEFLERQFGVLGVPHSESDECVQHHVARVARRSTTIDALMDSLTPFVTHEDDLAAFGKDCAHLLGKFGDDPWSRAMDITTILYAIENTGEVTKLLYKQCGNGNDSRYPPDVIQKAEQKLKSFEQKIAEKDRKLTELAGQLHDAQAQTTAGTHTLAMLKDKLRPGEQLFDGTRRLLAEHKEAWSFIETTWLVNQPAENGRQGIVAKLNERVTATKSTLARLLIVPTGSLDEWIVDLAQLLQYERETAEQSHELVTKLTDYASLPTIGTNELFNLVAAEKKGPGRDLRFVLSVGVSALTRALAQLAARGDDGLLKILKLEKAVRKLGELQQAQVGLPDKDTLWAHGLYGGFSDDNWLHELFRADLLLRTYFTGEAFAGIADAVTVLAAGMREVLRQCGHDVLPVALLADLPASNEWAQSPVSKALRERPEVQRAVAKHAARGNPEFAVDVHAFAYFADQTFGPVRLFQYSPRDWQS